MRRADGDVPPISRPRVVVLTREVHRAGRWVTALATTLEDRLRDVDAVVEIVCVERAAADASLLPAGGGRPQCALLVNRVSDAAPPATAKTASWTQGAPWLPPDDEPVELRYRDPKKMGKVYLLPAGVERTVAGWDSLLTTFIPTP